MAAKSKLPDVAPPRNRSWLVYAVVVALLAWYFFSAVSTVADKSTTFDEVFHLTGGYTAWKFGDFRMQPENGILPQRWAALPLLFSDTRFPELDDNFWQRSDMHEIGERFFYNVGNDADRMLLRGRAMIALMGVALGALVFVWTRSLLGVAPAIASVGLFAFCPTVLANGALVTSDMAAALFLSASMYCFWRVLHQVNWRTLAVGSLAMGGLFVSKFSAPLVAPMVLVLLAVQLMSREPTQITFGAKTWEACSRRSRLLVHFVTLAAYAAVVWTVIWAFYDFRYEMFAAKTLKANQAGELAAVDQPYISWDKLFEHPGTVTNVIVRMRDVHFLPEAYLYGFATTWRYSKERAAFFNGQYSTNGWRMFFPYCLLVKTPLTLFALMGFAIVAIVRGWVGAGEHRRGRVSAMLGSLYRAAPAWTLFIVYWLFAITSHLNIGHRHILPTYPPMLILAGGSALWLAKRQDAATSLQKSSPQEVRGVSRATHWLMGQRWPFTACIVLLSMGLFAGESLWRRPNYLAYFNQLVGGPWYAYRHLIESSLDWGQDLPTLKHWLVKEGLDASSTEKAYLAYFGSGNPEYYRISATLLPCYEDRMPPRIPEPLAAGTYCISATLLQNMYTLFPGRWNQPYETLYQQMNSTVRNFESNGPEGRSQLIAKFGQKRWLELFRQYEHLRLARLTSYLRQREPDFEINYSILVYRLEASDLSRALDGPPIELTETPNGGS